MASTASWVNPCWRSGGFSYAECCDLRFGPRGKDRCWYREFNYETCCLEEYGPLYVTLLTCGRCRWANRGTCWNYTRPSEVDASQGPQPMSERCVELCCGGFEGYVSRAALRRGTQTGVPAQQAHQASLERHRGVGLAPSLAEGLETRRRCQLHAASALFCEYEHLCVARAGAGWAPVFLRGGGGAGMWMPLQILASELSFNEAHLVSPLPEPLELAVTVAGGAPSVVLPAGFWWPPLQEKPSQLESAVVGWSQPAEQALALGADVRWLGYGGARSTANGSAAPQALIMGFDPAVAPRNLFHFAQLVLPAFSARLRLAWGDGSGRGAGLLEPLPAFPYVVLADPVNSTRLPWQQGLLRLVVGPGARLLYSGRGPRGPGPRMRCFRRAVVPGNGRKDRAVPASGRSDHAALLMEAARQIPALRGRPLGRDIVFARRGGSASSAQSRMIRNEAEFLAAVHGTVSSLWGPGPCSRLGIPCVLTHGGSADFAEQVRLFSRSSLLLGVNGAAFTNMLFMPPASVVLVLQPVGIRDYYTSMAHGCGHYGIPFFVDCVPRPPLEALLSRASARVCKEETACLAKLNDECSVAVDIPAFLPTLAAALSYAFPTPLARPEFAAARQALATLPTDGAPADAGLGPAVQRGHLAESEQRDAA